MTSFRERALFWCTLVVFFGIYFFSLNSFAARTSPHPYEESKPRQINVGALVGLDMISAGTTGSTNLGFGVRGQYELQPMYAVGLSFTTAAAGAPNSSLTLVMVDLVYKNFLKERLQPLFVGAKLGMGLYSSTASSANMALGLTAGYDYSITPKITVGPQLGYTMVFTGVTTSDIQIYAAARYWL